MADEFFYGATLKGENATVKWDPHENDDEHPERPNKLIVKQILLGVEAKEGEYNVVEVEATAKDKTIKIPIAVLKVGENRFSQSFLEFPDHPVTFKLIQGSGPVHINGHHLLGDIESLEDFEEEEVPEEDSDVDIKREEDIEEPKLKKQKLNMLKAVKKEKNHKD